MAKKTTLKKTKNKTRQQVGIGLTGEFIGGMVYMAHIILEHPKNLDNIDTQTVYDKDGLEIWVDREGNEVVGLQITHRWGNSSKCAKNAHTGRGGK